MNERIVILVLFFGLIGCSSIPRLTPNGVDVRRSEKSGIDSSNSGENGDNAPVAFASRNPMQAVFLSTRTLR